MYRTCAHPHCDVPFDHCQIHHVVPWEHGGASDIAKMLPACTKHHHLVHEGRWTLTRTADRTADRTIALTRPDGTTYFTGNTCDRIPLADHTSHTSQPGAPPGPPGPRRQPAA